MNGSYYLKANVVAEPLVDGWYAWAHLIPPATLSRNMTERHLRIIDSYLESPETHEAAVKDPRLLGGPFMDLKQRRVEDVKTLRERTLRERGHLVTLSRAIEQLDALLRQKAAGFSLESLYAEVPPALRGYVELVYDLNNQPSFRLIEPLLYKSPYYNCSLQTIALSEISGDDRPFVLSTPRLEGGDSLHLQIPFASERLDTLFRMKHEPSSETAIADALGLEDQDQARFRSFLTTESPRPYDGYDGDGARWRYFGHACILLEMCGVSLLFDPVLSYTYQSDISRYTYLDLPNSIDYVLITHNHQDHILFETLLQIRHKVKTIIVPKGGSGHLQDPSLKLILENTGFRNIIELGELEMVNTGQGFIRGLPFLGEHADLDIATKLAYLIQFGGHSLLFAADSCNIEPRLYQHLHREIGNIDVLFLGMECDGAPLSWLYGPLLSQPMERGMDESRRLAGSNYEQAMDIIHRLKCKEVYIYAMGQEPWLNHVMSLKYTNASRPIVESDKVIRQCEKLSITAERLFAEKEILVE